MRFRSTEVIVGVALLVGVGAAVAGQRGSNDAEADVIQPGRLVTVKAAGRPVEERTVAEIQPWLARLTRGGPPGVPYVAGGNLYDGLAKVSLPIAAKPQIGWTLGRVKGGWLVLTQDRDDVAEQLSGRYGVLTPAGRFEVIGAGRPHGAALSPDHSRLAYAVDQNIRVVDLATRQPTASLPTTSGSRVDGWNADGIWLHSAGGVLRWVPGSSPQRVGDATVHIPSAQSALIQERVGDCDRLLSGDGELKPQIEYCGFSPIAGVLSPAGQTFITPDQEARGVYRPSTVELDLLRGIPFGDVAWEDETHLLLTPPSSPVSVVRCDTLTGHCELALTADDVRLAPAN